MTNKNIFKSSFNFFLKSICVFIPSANLRLKVLNITRIEGKKSVVGKKFTQEYTCIAGNPAKVVKENVTWSREPV